MSPIPLAEAELLSYCVPDPAGPTIQDYTTDELRDELTGTMNLTNCFKPTALNATPSFSFVSSGGALPTSSIGIAATQEQKFSTIGASVEVRGDVHTMFSDVASVEAQLFAVLMGQFLGAANFAEPFQGNYRNFPWYASQNPLGVMSPTAGAGSAPVIKDLLAVRRRVVPHGSDPLLVFAMHSRTFEALVAAEGAERIQYRRTRLGGDVDRPCVGPSEVLFSDSIPTTESGTPNRSSVYAIRMKGSAQRAGTGGMALATSPTSPGVRVGPAIPVEGQDLYRYPITAEVALVGPLCCVARLINLGI